MSTDFFEFQTSLGTSNLLDDVIFRALVFRIRVFLHKICFFMPFYLAFVSSVAVFKNDGFSDNIGDFVLDISGEVRLYKALKNQKT